MATRSKTILEAEGGTELVVGRKERSLWERVGYETRRSPLAAAGMAIVLLSLLLAILAPYLAPYDPLSIDLPHKLLPPSSMHLFGTDDMGRDILSRCLYGMRISLLAAFTVLSLACSIGIILGGTAGYAGGKLDNILMRLTDMFLAFPALVLALAIAAALGASLTNAMLAVTAAWWPWYARLVRGQVLALKNNLYVETARVSGASDMRILIRHILPNCVSPILVMLTMDLGFVILMTASLSFLGLGAKPPTPELGAMISSGRFYFRESWWAPTFPGLTIFIMALGVNLLGDAWRDILDPRLRGR